MAIWILAVFTMVSVALAAWRQGAIRAAIAFVGIIIAAFLAVPLGHLFHPLLPHLGFKPITAWIFAPVAGFIVARAPFSIVSHNVYKRVEHFYKYKAGDLREALFTRLNTRLGICLGLLNGGVYFILISFFVFNLGYVTTQSVSPNAASQPITLRLVNSMGDGLQSTGFSRTAAAVGTLDPMFYKLADFGGLIMQNPQLGGRLGDYPGLTSLWRRDDMQPLVTDPLLTNAPAAGTPLTEIMGLPSVAGLIANKDLTHLLLGVAQTNLDDLTVYLNTGKTKLYSGEPVLGNWQFNAPVTLAWLRQDQPKMSANEMTGIRMLWAQAYGPLTILFTGQNEVFVQNFPKFVPPQPNQPAFEGQDWRGDWSRDGATYTIHISRDGQDKYLSATTDGLRLKLKDGRNQLILDHID